MDRDTFWDNFRDILFITIKVTIAFVGLQIILMVTGSDIKLPFVHAKMMKFFYWWKENFGGFRFGM